MKTKKIISLSLLLATSASLIECAASGSGNTAFQQAKEFRAAQAAVATAPAAAASTVTTSSNKSPDSEPGFTLISSNPVTTVGQPYSKVTIDPTTQTKPFKVGKTALDGHHKGIREASLNYVLRLAKDGQLIEALTDPIRTQQKTRERFSEGIIEGVDNLTKTTTAQTAECKNFSTQQASATTAFLSVQKTTTATLLARQRAELSKSTSDVDTVLQIVHTMPNAKGSLSDACIREELAKLLAVQRQKEESLKSQQVAAKTLLQKLTESFTALSQQQEDESNAQIIKIRALRELLHSSHPAPQTLTALSPRTPAAAPAEKGNDKK